MFQKMKKINLPKKNLKRKQKKEFIKKRKRKQKKEKENEENIRAFLSFKYWLFLFCKYMINIFTKDNIILLSVIAFIILELSIIRYTKLHKIDLFIIFSKIATQMLIITGISTHYKKFNDIGHSLVGILTLLIPVVSINKYILCTHIIIMFIAMGTRKINGRCLLRDYDPPKDEKAISRQIDLDWLTWDILFPSMGIISAVKIAIL